MVCQWLCGRVPDLQSGGCGFEPQPGLLRTKVYSAFHPSGVGKWVPAAAGKAKAGMAHSACGWTCGCAGKTVKSLENTRHTWALLQWCFTTMRRYIKCMYLYLLPIKWRGGHGGIGGRHSPFTLATNSTVALSYTNHFSPSVLWHCWLSDTKGIQLVKIWMLVCWWCQFNWCRIAPVVTTTAIILSSNKIHTGTG